MTIPLFIGILVPVLVVESTLVCDHPVHVSDSEIGVL